MKIQTLLPLIENESFVLLEYFKVPQSVLAPIKDYYMQSMQRAARDKVGRVTDSTFPPKKFKLDFSGTSFEFLNKIDTTMTVTFTSSASGVAYYPSERMIKVPLNPKQETPLYYYYSVLEHEILHFVQDLIRIYRRGHDKFYKSSMSGGYGGLAKKGALKDFGTDVNGHAHGAYRRTTHAYRPIEHLANLNTIIRNLEAKYGLVGESGDKKEFLLKYIKAEPLGILTKVRRKSEELYRIYLRSLYKAFINGIPMEDIVAANDKLKKQPKEKYEKGEVSVTDLISDVSKVMKNSLSSIDFHDMVMWSELEEGNYDFVEEINWFPSYENSNGDIMARVPLSPNRLKSYIRELDGFSKRHHDAEERRNLKTFIFNMLEYVFDWEYTTKHNKKTERVITRTQLEQIKEHMKTFVKSLIK